MKWKCKLEPEIGDTRILIKFLIFPKCVDGEWRWLETASILQYWEGWNYANEDSYECQLWKSLQYVD